MSKNVEFEKNGYFYTGVIVKELVKSYIVEVDEKHQGKLNIQNCLTVVSKKRIKFL